jgi:hypothetical protein
MEKAKKEEKTGKSNKTKYNVVLIVVLVGLGLGLAWASNGAECCSADNGAETTPVVADNTKEPSLKEPIAKEEVKVELYHFHATQQCYSCVRLGELAEKTVETYFADEMESGKLVFEHINYDLSENRKLSKKYGVTGSSLWIGTTVGGEFTKEENINVWYKLNDEKGYLNYLKGVLDKRLLGELN